MAKRRYGTSKRFKEIERKQKAQEKMEKRQGKIKTEGEDLSIQSLVEERAEVENDS